MQVKRGSFDTKYPFHHPTKKNWFILRVAGLGWSGAPMFSLDHNRITQRKLSEMALIEAKKKTERASGAKSAFLSSTSHELCTPLNSILGFSQLVVTDPGVLLNDNQAVAVAQILFRGGHLMNLLDDSLKLSSIKAGQFWISAERVDIKAACAECLAILWPLAKDQGLSVTSKFAADSSIVADTKSPKQIFINTLSNALKYNRQGGSVSLITEVTPENRVGMRVIDTGLGIPPGLYSQVFESFERLG